MATFIDKKLSNRELADKLIASVCSSKGDYLTLIHDFQYRTETQRSAIMGYISVNSKITHGLLVPINKAADQIIEMNKLLEKVIVHLELKKCEKWTEEHKIYESDKYFVYIGTFPEPHVAIANRGGTTVLHTLQNEVQMMTIKP